MVVRVVVHFLDANSREELFKMESVINRDNVEEFLSRVNFCYNPVHGTFLNDRRNIIYKFKESKNVYHIGIFTGKENTNLC